MNTSRADVPPVIPGNEALNEAWDCFVHEGGIDSDARVSFRAGWDAAKAALIGPAAPQATAEPVAKHHGATVVAGLAELIPLIDNLGAVAMGFVQSEPTPEKAKLLMNAIDRLLQKRDFLDFGPVAAPAAPRHAPSVEEIARVIDGVLKRHFRSDVSSGYRDQIRNEILSLLTTPDRGEARGEGSMPYTLQSGEGGTFLQAHAGQLFICADINTVRRCLSAIGTPPAKQEGDR